MKRLLFLTALSFSILGSACAVDDGASCDGAKCDEGALMPPSHHRLAIQGCEAMAETALAAAEDETETLDAITGWKSCVEEVNDQLVPELAERIAKNELESDPKLDIDDYRAFDVCETLSRASGLSANPDVAATCSKDWEMLLADLVDSYVSFEGKSKRAVADRRPDFPECHEIYDAMMKDADAEEDPGDAASAREEAELELSWCASEVVVAQNFAVAAALKEHFLGDDADAVESEALESEAFSAMKGMEQGIFLACGVIGDAVAEGDEHGRWITHARCGVEGFGLVMEMIRDQIESR